MIKEQDIQKMKDNQVYVVIGSNSFSGSDLMGRDFEASTIAVGERLGQDATYVIDSTRAREELGWCPRISLKEGLAEVIAWVEDNWEQVQRGPLEYIHKP